MKKFLLAIFVLFCCAVASHAQAEYPDVTFEDSAYADINVLAQSGVIEIPQPCYGSGAMAMTRYEFAVAIARLLEQLDSTDGILKTATPTSEVPNLNKPEVTAAIKRLANKFLPELKALGVDVEKIKINGELLIEPKVEPAKIQVVPPFADVPKNHWAFNAVEKLRQSGILIGFPDGK